MKFMLSYSTKISLRFDLQKFYTKPREKENNQHIISFHSVQVVMKRSQFFMWSFLCPLLQKEHHWQTTTACFLLLLPLQPLQQLVTATDTALPQEIQVHTSANSKEIHTCLKTYKKYAMPFPLHYQDKL